MNTNRHFSIHLLRNPLVLRLFFLRFLPMGFFSGLRLPVLNEEQCSVRVRYRWSNKNPFGSIYFAVLAMAAELSTGVLVLLHLQKLHAGDVRFIVTRVSGTFHKKARGKIIFTCTDHEAISAAVNHAVQSDREGQEKMLLSATGVDEAGDEVAQFKLEWVFSKRPAEIAS